MAATRAGTSNNSYDHSDDDSILENDLMDTDDGVPSVFAVLSWCSIFSDVLFTKMVEHLQPLKRMTLYNPPPKPRRLEAISSRNLHEAASRQTT
jgi:hypothetical protein